MTVFTHPFLILYSDAGELSWMEFEDEASAREWLDENDCKAFLVFNRTGRLEVEENT